MRILFRKISSERHGLEIVRDDGRGERIECETRSTLAHDLLHYAAEFEAGLGGGFWGTLAAGRTLAEMNDRSGLALEAERREMAAIEQVVGPLSGGLKGLSPPELAAGLRRFAAGMGTTMPGWLTEALIVAVQERMRGLMGRWRATPFGEAMELAWPERPASGGSPPPARAAS